MANSGGGHVVEPRGGEPHGDERHQLSMEEIKRELETLRAMIEERYGRSRSGSHHQLHTRSSRHAHFKSSSRYERYERHESCDDYKRHNKYDRHDEYRRCERYEQRRRHIRIDHAIHTVHRVASTPSTLNVIKPLVECESLQEVPNFEVESNSCYEEIVEELPSDDDDIPLITLSISNSPFNEYKFEEQKVNDKVDLDLPSIYDEIEEEVEIFEPEKQENAKSQIVEEEMSPMEKSHIKEGEILPMKPNVDEGRALFIKPMISFSREFLAFKDPFDEFVKSNLRPNFLNLGSMIQIDLRTSLFEPGEFDAGAFGLAIDLGPNRVGVG